MAAEQDPFIKKTYAAVARYEKAEAKVRAGEMNRDRFFSLRESAWRLVNQFDPGGAIHQELTGRIEAVPFVEAIGAGRVAIRAERNARYEAERLGDPKRPLPGSFETELAVLRAKGIVL